MKEKLKLLKELLDSDQFDRLVPVEKDTLLELITTVEAVSAPNLLMAIERFQLHCVRLDTRLKSQVESINRLLETIGELKKK